MSQSFVLGSGLANKKTVTIQPADKDQGVVLATTKTKKQNKPKVSVNKSILKKEFPRMSKAVANQVILYLYSTSFYVCRLLFLVIGYLQLFFVFTCEWRVHVYM